MLIFYEESCHYVEVLAIKIEYFTTDVEKKII